MRTIDKFFGRQALAVIEKERQELLGKSYQLERNFVKKLLGRADYNDIKAAIHKKIVLLDLEKAMEENAGRLGGIQEKAGMLSETLAERAENMLRTANDALGEARDAKSGFLRNRVNAGELHDALELANSALVDAFHAIEEMMDRGRKEKAMEIMAEMKLKLEDAWREHVAKAGKKRELVEVPRRERVKKLKHYSGKRKRKHLT